ncbi:MAG: tRNA pseudouridine(38-40) synthase TruA [Desulfovibrionales bacterium]
MIRLKLTLAYRGTQFFGWQVQPRGRTVQGCLETIVSRMIGQDCRIIGSGRTDSGVHALGQVAHVDVPAAKAEIPWQKALNAQLPRDVAVTGVRRVSETFHARFSPSIKTYSYTLWQEQGYVLPQRGPYVWPVSPLDLEAMARAASGLVGEHDFAAFQNTGSEVTSTIRTLHRIAFMRGQHPGELVLVFSANGFLKQMVRNLVGTLVAVGSGSRSPADVPELLIAADRTALPATAPAQGLCLERVWYADPQWNR